jgi:AhpD family alkylhydroperoxidase
MSEVNRFGVVELDGFPPVANSGANHCSYCVVAHGAILRISARDPQLADYVASNPWAAALDPRQRAIVDLALVIATRSAQLSEHDVQRPTHLMALRPNAEFFTMGRAARGSRVQPDTGPAPDVRPGSGICGVAAASRCAAQSSGDSTHRVGCGAVLTPATP